MRGAELKATLPQTIIVMGVAGCGKSVVGKKLAEKLGGVFEDGDDFHSEEAKAKMQSGTPLTDADREPWYGRIRARVEHWRSEGRLYVLASSALKQKYRDWLSMGDSPEQLRFVHLAGSFKLIHDRMALRKNHFMPLSLLESQFAALERPTDALEVEIDRTVDEIVEEVLRGLGVA